ncbi:Receptor-type tyrosine-protein phosphatase-like N [Echinococcus granulosus]|uniref:Receptor-type tyrosine-protein phosphatase-like N n=1 Tax=Echinococcus granulosus TaxID=6210 RepID=W6ULN8_ECHGR|nr:Receptor-type tyrosine-protein phosphatase-like N [Echinococcus granulosus]EUB61958.1 Receptor-type tyrosine-protein phosphatase-like N [Echinococcus granulosus]
MLSFKIWPLVLALYSFIVDRNHVVLSVTHVLSSEKRNLNTVVGGYVGCLISDVCMPSETCQDDNLFGKCVEGNFDGSTYKLSYAERSLLNNIGTDFLRIGLDFSDLYVQCVFRGLILKFRLQDERMDIVKLCGEMPIEVIDNYKVEYTADDSEKLDALGAEGSMPAKKFIGRLKSFDFKEIPEEEAFGEGLEFQKGVIRRFPDRPMRTWAFGGDPSLSTKYFHDFVRKFVNDETSKNHEHKLLEDEKMVVKRFNRDKVLKFGTAEFDRRTKNTIWLRLLKPVNYIEADNILQELSENMHIRPPIAQFQLDKTGHVLLFFVPFETGLVASDVLNMMRQNAQWMKQNKVFQYGIGMPVLTEPIAAPHTVGKIEHLPETGDYAMGGMGRRQSNGNTGVGGHLSRVGFVAVVVVCSLAVLVALLLVAHILVRRRDRLNDYLAGPMCKGPRKPSERPLVPPASPSASIAASAGRNDSLEKQHQETLSSCSTTSPPPYQETPEQGEKQGIFRRQIVSTGGSEASTESMASAPSHRTTQLSSNLSWSNEPVQMTLDITTGHLILSYMEEHLRNRDRLDADWEEVNTYESEEAVPCESAKRPENAHKNREGCPIPYEQTRVMLSCRGNGYINASLMYDHDPRNPSYIAAETPLLSTVGDFWQMVWEQFAVLIVCLEPESALTQVIEDLFNITGQGDDDVTSQARYWPPEGSMIFGKFERFVLMSDEGVERSLKQPPSDIIISTLSEAETTIQDVLSGFFGSGRKTGLHSPVFLTVLVRLVSEHRQCSDYITRSFYLKERDSGETRTVTQFHFLSWPEDTPSCELKTLLEFRRKVNKSFRAKNSPVVVHCRDGSSKTGTYLLLDLVLSRISKGVKELDVAASLEHLRDQRQGMIKSKAQFELVLAAIAEEVNMMLSSAAS